MGSLKMQAGSRPLIVQVVRQFWPNRGGFEDVIGNLSRQLLDRGYRVRVVTCDRLFSAPDKKLPSRETLEGIDIVRIPWSGSSRYPLAPRVFAHIRDADLIHVHAIDFFFDALAWGRILHRRPMVATTHGGFFHTPNYAAIKKIWFRSITRLSALGYARLICCSEPDFKLFSGIAADRAVLVENGVDTEKFAGGASPRAVCRIVTIGRFSVNKRLDRMLDMMKVLTARDPAWHLDIIGSVYDLDEAALRQEIGKRGLVNHVSLHVSLENAAIRSIIGGASLFASASEYEGFGLVAVEAMSAGLLPVLHPNKAYRSLAARHGTVKLADFASPSLAADAVIAAYESLLADGNELRQAIRSEVEPYSWNTVADRYVDVYRTMLADR